MNTKKKNKNRPKPPKTPPKPTESDKIISLDNVTTKMELECEKKEDSASAVTVTNVELLIEEKVLAEEIPKKPERSKGKKKQEEHSSNTLVDNIEKTDTGVDDDPTKTEFTIDDSKLAPVTSKSRKKKHKDKKQSDTQDIYKASVSDVVDENGTKEDLQLVTVTDTPQVDKNQEQDTKINKKKKKKRNRHDSEKSDVIEGTPCTLAFQKLLQSTENEDNLLKHGEEVISTNESVDDCNIQTSNKDDSIVKESVEETNLTDNLTKIKDEDSMKNKKKNKKHNKQQPQNSDDRSTKNVSVSSLSDKKEVDSLETNEPISIEESIGKAKIAKPVDRKRKIKEDKGDTPFDAKDTKSKMLQKDIDEEKKLELTSTSKACESVSLETLGDTENKTIGNKDQVDNQDMPTDTTDIEKKEEIFCQTLHSDISESKISIKDANELNDDKFMEVKPSKKKKKQLQKHDEFTKIVSDTESLKTVPKLQLEPNIEETGEKKLTDLIIHDKSHMTDKSHTEKSQETLFTEEHQNKIEIEQTEESNIIIPDLIQYPRSVSQQLFDNNNNNTFIQEISPTDELKLGLPICTPTPIIQGSGETPEAKQQQDPLHSKLTEIDSKLNKCVQEKTDIKSKMMEVNQDMEELRLSIERSLAELTALDKSDKEFEKKMSENTSKTDNKVFSPDAQDIKTNISIPMPSSFIEITTSSSDDQTLIQKPKNPHVCVSPEKEITSQIEEQNQTKLKECSIAQTVPPVCPSRKDNKGKSKSKKKNKQESTRASSTSCSEATSSSDNKNTTQTTTDSTSEQKKSEKSNQTQKETQEKGKQQSAGNDNVANIKDDSTQVLSDSNLEPIEKFEDALTSSVDDVNQSFEMIASEVMKAEASHQHFDNPQINIIAPTEDEDKEKNSKKNPVSPPKNLLGHPDIPVPSNKTDYKKEKNKVPNSRQAKVKIKDSVDIEKAEKISKQSQTYNKRNNSKNLNGSESFSYKTNGNDEYIYKYSFRKVFLQSSCHVCKRELSQRYSCKFCCLIFYCSQKHMDEDWPRHQALCFAVSTISHLKDQKYLYADSKNITGQDYRVLRMQMIVSCEKILKRKLVPWEQEALLYPRMCADVHCREWRQLKLKDCVGCEQISYCIDHPDHLPNDHVRWCKSYALYQKLVNYQQTKGRLEPPMPTKVLEHYEIPEKINDVLASMFEEKIDMNDIQYAALTQLATAPLTVAYSYQLFTRNINALANGLPKKTAFTIHVVGAELQFEADGLNKWEVFLLHLRPEIKELNIVLVGPDLNPSNLPLDLLGKVKLCESCKVDKRRVVFSFQDKMTYHAYYSSDEFTTPDIVCAFNPSIQRSSIYNGRDSWPSTIKCILKQKIPFVMTAYTLEELQRDLTRVKEFGDYNIVSEAKQNPFASVRPDRNFITDHEIPLLFKNYCFSIVCGV